MKNNYKGFTLIELIAVITILGLLILLAIPKITGLIGFNKIEARNKIDKSIISAAINYGVDNNLVGDSIIKIDDLCNGYIDCPIIDPVTNENLNVCVEKKVVDGIDKYEIINDLGLCNSSIGTDFIIKLEGQETTREGCTGTGELVKVEHENGDIDYRYTGACPNNYATFNNETWRIIGVFTINGEQRIKLLRDELIGHDTFHLSLSHDSKWKNSDIDLGLNGNYLSSIGYLGSSLSSDAQNLIDDAEWYSTRLEKNQITSSAYIAERTEPAIIGKVALIYPSDYGYASSACYNDSTKKLYDSNEANSYRSDVCKNSNWMYTNMTSVNNAWWTMMPILGNSSNALEISYNGLVDTAGMSNSLGIRPTLYLKSGVKMSGDGTPNNKYNFYNY